MGPKPRPIVERFSEKVIKTDHCWLWHSRRDRYGYGRFKLNGKKQVSAHVLAWELHTGQKRPPRMCILHKCDNRQCVNPEHLFLGTNRDNNADMVSKGRHSHGESHGEHKLTENQVREIRARYFKYKHRLTKQLAKEFGVTEYCIRKVVSRQSWRHI